MDLLNLKTYAFGLDISDLSLKIAKLKNQGRFFNLASFGEEEIKSGIIKEGEIKDEIVLAKIIKEAVKKITGEKLKTKYVIVSLPEEKAFLQVIQLPKMSEEDLKSAVIFEAENYIPLPVDQVYLDYQIVRPLDNNFDHLDVLLAALPKSTIDPYIDCLKSAGLKPKALEIESLAIGRALIKNETSSSSVLLIDMGATRTSFIVYSGSSLRFTSSIPISCQHFTQIISKALNVSLPEAEKLKIKYGLISDAKSLKGQANIFEALVPSLVDLVQQIKKHLDYYQGHSINEHLAPKDKGVSKIMLCGGGANLKGFPEFLSGQLKITVELGNPWVNILPGDKPAKRSSMPPATTSSGVDGGGETVQLPPGESLRYVTALGLALRGVKVNAQ
jgi:type IV pilus assembly protein PilM